METVKCIFCKKEIAIDRALWLGTINIRREKMYACGCTTPKDDDSPLAANSRCDLCGEEVGEGFHNCPMPDPGDPFKQPFREWYEPWLG